MSNRFRSKENVPPGVTLYPSKWVARKTNGRGQSASPLGPPPKPMARTYVHRGTRRGSRTRRPQGNRVRTRSVERWSQTRPAGYWPTFPAESAPTRAPQRKIAADRAENAPAVKSSYYHSALTGIINATVFTTPLRWIWIHTR